ncbi:MAG: LPP20 family lipoprotein [Treponema sp.]|jgi:hypothetical protein|nr:LPP20 family lipoprotein [Treponema sp.]
MSKLKFICLLSCLLALGACASSPSGASPADAQDSAQDALGRLDGQTGRPADAPSVPYLQQPSNGQNVSSSQASAQQTAVVNTSRTKPAWVDSVESVYKKSQYVAAVGYASDRAMAEKNGFANLAGFFGQSIYADQTITNTYREAVKNGVTSGWTDNINMENTIKTTASLETLAAAEIREVWHDTKNNVFYAAAVMEKAKAAVVYTDMITANQNMIKNLITMSQAEKNSMEGFSRYQFSAAAADINITYGNVLKLIDAPVPAGLVKGDEYRLEAQNIAKSIPIGIVVKNDKAGRIQGAFAKALSDIGFRSGGNNSRYVLNVDVSVSPVDLPNNTNKFARIELGANLTDTSVKSVLLPYNFNSREGHATAAEAENRAYTAAERKIGEEYKNILFNYLSQLLPKK